MSSFLSAELAATCSALGYYDPASKKYYGDKDTLETVKDLIRYLRRDDENHDIRRQLGNAKVVQTDLIPMMKSYWEETELFDVLLRLLVNLTTPAIALWNDEIPSDKITRNYYIQVVDHLKSYKEAFADQDVWSVLSRRLSKTLETDYTERGDENSLIIERILILLRNILYVPIEPYLERPDDDASVHDQVLWALHQSGMLDIILYISSSSSEQAYYMHIVEILYFMLREQKASDLARAALQRSESEKLRDEAELLAMRHREAYEKQKKIKKYAGARHSRFGGTFVVKSLKSISDNELIYHKPLNKINELSFDSEKKRLKTPKNRQPISGSTFERRSAFSIRLFLKEFCIEFLNGAYNTFLNYIKHVLVRGQTQNNDESYYFWAMRFFMEMNRNYKFDIRLVSETMSLQTFHYVQREMEKYFDLMQTDKKNVKPTSRRLHLALLAYRELFLTLCAMDKSADETVRDSSKVIKSNIFYVPEYRELIITLLITYDELKSSDLYLNDLIETQHIFFKLLEKFSSNTGGVVVKSNTRSKKKKKPGAKAKLKISSEHLDAMWHEAAPQLSVILESSNSLVSDESPFDAGSDIPIDEQKTEAMRKIQRKLRNGQFEDAIGLLHASREVWPENDEFGNSNMSKEDEFSALKDIFLANIEEIDSTPTPHPPDEDNEEDEEEEELYEEFGDEKEYKIQDFIKRLAHPKVVRACGLSLKNFEKNTVNINLCTIKLLHRIAFDCKMYVMLFQLSIFRTFQNIFKVKELPQHRELVKFAVYIIRQFFNVAEKNKKVYMETLFWKTNREAFDIGEGYGSYQEKSATKTWTEQDEDELRRLFMEHREKQIEEDVVDWIVDNLIDNTRTRRGVLKKLKDMMLITDNRSKKNAAKVPRIWSEEEEAQLRELFDQFREASDPIGRITERMSIPRSRNKIIEKLLTLGVIQNKSEVRKKRTKKSTNPESEAQFDDGDEELSTEESSTSNDEDDDRENEPLQRNNRSQTQNDRPKTNQSRGTKGNSTKKSTRPKKADKNKLIKLLLELDPGLHQALEWLKESFSDAIEDMADTDGDEGCSLPLVPIMDYAVDAIENKKFQGLLKAMGVVEPFQGQEIYWRIPESMSSGTLTEYVDLLAQTIDNTLQHPETSQETMGLGNTENNNANCGRNQEDGPEELFNRKQSSSRVIDSDSEDETRTREENSTIADTVADSDQANIDVTAQNAFATKHASLRLIGSDSEDEVTETNTQGDFNDEPDQDKEIANDTYEKSDKKKRSRVLIDSGSEDEESRVKNNLNFNQNDLESYDSENTVNSDISHKKRPAKRLRIIDSDEDD